MIGHKENVYGVLITRSDGTKCFMRSMKSTGADGALLLCGDYEHAVWFQKHVQVGEGESSEVVPVTIEVTGTKQVFSPIVAVDVGVDPPTVVTGSVDNHSGKVKHDAEGD